MAVSRLTRAQGVLTVKGAVLALAGVALAGCTSGSPTPGATTPVTSSTTSPSTPTTTASPTKSADPVLAKIPAAARAETMAGAEAFAAFYVGQMNLANTKASPEALQGLSTEACANCEAFISAATAFRAKGWHHDRPTFVIKSATASAFNADNRQVTVFVSQQAVNVVDVRGRTQKKLQAAEGAFIFTLDYADHWVVTRLQTAKS